MSPGRRAQTSAESRARILGAAAELVAELGLRATTVHAVAERAGISHTSVAWHFGSKDGLACAVTEAAFSEVFARFAALADEPGTRSVDRLLEAHREITASRPGQVFARVLTEAVVHDGPLRDIYVNGYRRIRELVADYLQPLVAASASTEPAAVVAGAVFAAGAGINLLRAVEAGASRRAGFAVLASVFAIGVAPSETPGETPGGTPGEPRAQPKPRKATARAGAALIPTSRSGKTPKVKPVAGS